MVVAPLLVFTLGTALTVPVAGQESNACPATQVEQPKGIELGDYLRSWPSLEPYVARLRQGARAEALFAQSGDHRNELYAKIGRIRAEAETMSFVDISEYLSAELKTPLVQGDPELKLWCLTLPL